MCRGNDDSSSGTVELMENQRLKSSPVPSIRRSTGSLASSINLFDDQTNLYLDRQPVCSNERLDPRGHRAIARASMPSKCMVPACHSVSANGRSQFAGQMDVLLRNAKPVSAAISSFRPEHNRCAAVTIDDGLENVFEIPCRN